MIGAAQLRSVHRTLSGRPRLFAGLFLLALVAALFGHVLFRGRMIVLDDGFTSDLLNANVPPRAFLGEVLRSGRYPLWFPAIFGGIPLVPQGEAAATSPLTCLLYGGFDWVTATTLSVAVHTWLAGFGTALLALRLGVRLPAALLAAVGFMLCGPLVGHIKHMNLHHAACWLPWMLLVVDRLREAPSLRTALELGVVAALQFTEGHPQVSHIAFFAAVPWFVLRLVGEGHRPGRRYLLRLVGALSAAAAVVFVLAGAYALAGAELAALSERGATVVDKWAYATRFPFLGKDLWTLVLPYVYGDASRDNVAAGHGIFWEFWLYGGALPVVLGLATALLGWRAGRRRAWIVAALAVLAGLSVALMFGGASPVYRLAFHVVPGMSWFRFPQRFCILLLLSLDLLAALGLDAVLRRARFVGPRLAGVLGVGALAATAGDLVGVLARQVPSVPGDALARPPATVAALRAVAPEEPFRIMTLHAPQSHLEATRGARGWSADLGWYVAHRALLQVSSNAHWGIETPHGYTSLAPYDTTVVVGSHTVPGVIDSGLTHSPVRAPGCPGMAYQGPCAGTLQCRESLSQMLASYDVHFVLSPVPLVGCPHFELVASVPSGPFDAWLYLNELALPRAYVVDEIAYAPSALEAARSMLRPSFSAARTVLRTGTAPDGVVDPPAVARSAEARACDYRSPREGEALVHCDLDWPGYLVVADARYPGQEVLLDGAPVEPFTAQGFLVGLELDAGQHEIAIRYRPRYAPLLWAGLCSWALMILVALTRGARRLGRALSRLFARFA